MRPFKFFFALSLGIALFLFFARFLVVAFIAALVLSAGFFFIRRIREWTGRREDDAGYGYAPRHLYPAPRILNDWQSATEPLADPANRREEWLRQMYTVRVE